MTRTIIVAAAAVIAAIIVVAIAFFTLAPKPLVEKTTEEIGEAIGPTASDVWDGELRRYAYQRYKTPLVERCVRDSGKNPVDAFLDCDTHVEYKVLGPLFGPIMQKFIACTGGGDSRIWPQSCADTARLEIDKAPVPGF